VGFGDDATHTTGRGVCTTIGIGIDPHQHPSFVLRDCSADSYTFDNLFGGKWLRLPLSCIRLFKALCRAVISRLIPMRS